MLKWDLDGRNIAVNAIKSHLRGKSVVSIYFKGTDTDRKQATKWVEWTKKYIENGIT